jgi:hypothetical protein
LPQDAPAGVAGVFLFINHLILQENGGEIQQQSQRAWFWRKPQGSLGELLGSFSETFPGGHLADSKRATPCAKMQASSLIRSSRDMSVGSVWLVMRKPIEKLAISMRSWPVLSAVGSLSLSF